MERSLVRVGDCSEVSRCFITEISCALLIYIERQSGNGQGMGGEAAGEEQGKQRQLGRKEVPEDGAELRNLCQLC